MAVNPEIEFKEAKRESRNANLAKKPKAHVCEHRNLSLGDLHGNALKLLHFLVENSIVEISDDEYNSFYEAYLRDIDHKAIQNQKELIDELIEKIMLKDNPIPLLRFIGDELADRGENDYINLKIFKKLDELGVPFEIYQSNHTLEFTRAYEELMKDYRNQQQAYRKAKKAYQDANENPNASQDTKTELERILIAKRAELNNALTDLKLVPKCALNPGQAQSLENFNQYLENNLLSASDLDDLLEVHERHQKLVGYSVTNTEITLYSHAPMDISLVKHLANKFGVKYCDKTTEELANTIEKINDQYACHLANGTVETNIDKYVVEVLASGGTCSRSDHPIEHLCWDRKIETLDRSTNHNNYSVHYVHGHTDSENDPDNIINLDSCFGKFKDCFITGKYSDDKSDFWVGNPVFHDDGMEIREMKLTRIIDFLTNECTKYKDHLDVRGFGGVPHSEGALLTEKQKIVSDLLSILEFSSEEGTKSRSENLIKKIERFQEKLNENKETLKENTHECRAFFRGVGIVLAKLLTGGCAFSNESVFFRSHGRHARNVMNREIERSGLISKP